MASDILAMRRRRIIGNQFKGRGIFMRKSMDTLLKHVPAEWWGRKKRKGRPDQALLGSKWRVFDRIKEPAFGTANFPGMAEDQSKRKILERIYWPADVKIPSKFASLEDRGEFEIRDVVKGEFVLWRDFTPEERTRMGEIVDARYAIAKTYLQMAHDLSTGRFFQDIATNQDWASKTDPVGDSPTARSLGCICRPTMLGYGCRIPRFRTRTRPATGRWPACMCGPKSGRTWSRSGECRIRASGAR